MTASRKACRQKSTRAPNFVYSGVTIGWHKLGMDSPHPPQPPILSCGGLLLNTAARTLTGPTGTCDLHTGELAVLRELMRHPGVTLETARLIAARWCADLEPPSAETAIRMAVSRAREAIRNVGGDPGQLRAVYRVGYRLDGNPRVVCACTPEAFQALQRLISTHPDQSLAAGLGAFLDAQPCNGPAFAGAAPAGAAA